MDERQALIALGAMSQETRLKIVRLLVKAGPDGMAAGSIAEAAGVTASNVSFHLKELERGGLVTARRDARSIVYSADYQALSGLIRFLMEDCCAGNPAICQPALAPACC
ncbi:ArsR family transcriptional regulator [Aminobacter sp. Y103A]|jgi:ArsR family transcriptional regulator|uniref:ArsR/SmtB family transcription factor n=1 Tax=unclassified Aminobacter TaxID=2644704 RepID=UPI0012B07C30|nr:MULTISPECIES: metalloregulator ArsR/SmtB family transcription factor [unclassified Aminobacter]MRX33633.1 metalloregulator ArsR/SmtB family transcription factor [Aminobacter sp. MDW-2]QNH33323.1 helix-turn-helix transcriptional regulator [Aminobacter sp. MDW-2]WMC98859.1 metalloregulator ArsR/SmtB family transcription factor [Aminobacter aminovorans]BBD37187.1 ArsR family transcriptional regulator [Aminobacter sp. SS-2016]